MKPLKQKKCKSCGKPFTPHSSLQKVCSVKCSIDLVNAQKAKKQRQETARQRVALRPRREWLKLAQQTINQYIRLRDLHEGCISCDRPSTWQGQWHASHFRSVGAASAVRFNLWNIHKSCSICNNWKSGNLSDYEPRLRAKIGDEKVDWLKSQNQTTNYSVEYLQRLIKLFRKKVKRIESRQRKDMI